MQRIKKLFRFPWNPQQILIISLLLLVLDTCAAGLSGYFLYASFFSWRGLKLLSDLLFIEGAIGFAVGSFLYFFFSMGHQYRDKDSKHYITASLGARMMVISVLLIIMSISIGELLI